MKSEVPIRFVIELCIGIVNRTLSGKVQDFTEINSGWIVVLAVLGEAGDVPLP